MAAAGPVGHTAAMQSESAVTVERINAFLADEIPFCAEMGLTCQAVTAGTATVRFAHDDRWTRPGGIVCGPVLMALADVAAYIAILTRVGIVPMAVTNELKINFLRPAIGHDVLARATVLKLGRRVAYAAVELIEPQAPDRLVGHATTSYMMPDR
jgi:uncharacterized protein (TIGR00369 family)